MERSRYRWLDHWGLHSRTEQYFTENVSGKNIRRMKTEWIFLFSACWTLQFFDVFVVVRVVVAVAVDVVFVVVVNVEIRCLCWLRLSTREECGHGARCGVKLLRVHPASRNVTSLPSAGQLLF